MNEKTKNETGSGETAGHPNDNAMMEAAAMLSDLSASFEYPGWISVSGMAFGDVDGDAYRFNREDGSELDGVPAEKAELPITATAGELAEWIREIVGLMKEAA